MKRLRSVPPRKALLPVAVLLALIALGAQAIVYDASRGGTTRGEAPPGGFAPRIRTDAPTKYPPMLATSRGAVRYVSTTGSDTASGKRGHPWRTINHAAAKLRPGQTALVDGGLYEENIFITRGGTRKKPITIRNAPGQHPILRPDEVDPRYVVLITHDAGFLRLHGFVIERAQGHSIQDVFVAEQAHDIEISGCEIRYTQNSTGVFVDDTTKRVQLIGNVVHDNNERGGFQHQGIYFEGHDGLIANNVVYHHTHGFGIQIRAGADRVLVTNNTTVDNSISGIMVENTASNVAVVNNVSAFNGSYAVRGFSEGGEVLPGNVAFANVSFANENGDYGNYVPGVIHFGRNYVGDPRFVNAAAHDFRLRRGSAAANRALRRYAPPFDFNGRKRPRGRAPDAGAFER